MHLKVLALFVFCCFFAACKPDPEIIAFDCDAFKSALTNLDRDAAAAVLNPAMSELLPNPSKADPEGHSDNFNMLVDHIKSQCAITVDEAFYATYFSLPAMSSIKVTFMSGQDTIVRTIFISMPSDGKMTLSGISE